MRNTDIARRNLAGLLGIGGLSSAGSPAAASPAIRAVAAVNVLDHGAVGDGVRMNTTAIQSAVDACSKRGGAVFFPPGAYLSGTIVLKSGVTLHLSPGSVLRGSTRLADYPSRVPAMRSYADNYTDKSLIYAENVHDVGIEGRGVIDGQGGAFKGDYKLRPYTLRFIGCRNVWVSDVALRDSPMWVQHYLGCENVSIRGVEVRSRVNLNNDGIDIDSCERVRISDCDVWTGDDSIVLKSTTARPCKDVVITNCILSSLCNALKMGTESNGGFENTAISNCTIYDTTGAAIALEIVDGGIMDRVAISNITMRRVGSPIFVRLGDRARPVQEGDPRPPAGQMRNVTIRGVDAVECGVSGCTVAGVPHGLIENLTIENVRLSFTGGGKPEDALRDVPEHVDKYPRQGMFGPVLPAYGLYCRHLRNFKLRDVETRYDGTDGRPALVADDVDGFELAGASLAVDPDSGPCVRLNRVRNGFVHGCRAASSGHAFLHAAASQDIHLAANDLKRARKEIETA